MLSKHHTNVLHKPSIAESVSTQPVYIALTVAPVVLVEGLNEVCLAILWVEEHHWPDQSPCVVLVDTPLRGVWPLHTEHAQIVGHSFLFIAMVMAGSSQSNSPRLQTEFKETSIPYMASFSHYSHVPAAMPETPIVVFRLQAAAKVSGTPCCRQTQL